MILLHQSVKIEHIDISHLNLIEKAGRTCYKSEDKTAPHKTLSFIKGIIESGHESVIEHSLISVRFITNRGVSHELVRHRLAAFSQESTRYCNYNKKGIQFIIPYWAKNIKAGEWTEQTVLQSRRNLTSEEIVWLEFMLEVEKVYNFLSNAGLKLDGVRGVLPNDVKTELVMSANFREWRHIFKLRTSERAHPQMREIMNDLLKKVRDEIPVIFDDI